MNGPGFRNAIAKGQDYPIVSIREMLCINTIDSLNCILKLLPSILMN